MSSTSKPTLLVLAQLPPPVHGASTINSYVTKSAYLEERIEKIVLPLQFADSIEDLGRVSLRKLTKALGTGLELVRLLGLRRPDAVYISLSPTGGAYYRDVLYAAIVRGFGRRRIYHLHGTGLGQQLRPRWRYWLAKYLLHDADVILLSPRLADELEGSVPPERLWFVPNGVPELARATSERRPAEVGPPGILYLSHMVRSKGPLVLLDALARLHRRGIPFRATFAGAPSSDGTLELFQRTVAQRELHDVVSYIGPVHGAAKDALYDQHEIFVQPTLRDAFPLVVLEAMRHALPVVGTTVGALPEMVVDGVTGHLVPPNDVKALTTSLATLLVDHSARQRAGTHGRERYLQHYTLATFEQALTDTLTRCIAR